VDACALVLLWSCFGGSLIFLCILFTVRWLVCQCDSY